MLADKCGCIPIELYQQTPKFEFHVIFTSYKIFFLWGTDSGWDLCPRLESDSMLYVTRAQKKENWNITQEEFMFYINYSITQSLIISHVLEQSHS